MSPYKHIFFDLDRTLWDMESNSRQTLMELLHKYDLQGRGVADLETFIERYNVINHQLWSDYSANKLDKESLRYGRFRKSFALYGIHDEDLAIDFGNDYVAQGPLKSNLIPHTIEVLEHLEPNYELHIITNGFEEAQHVKIERSGLKKYFKEIITSERAGWKKPDTRIFDFSLKAAGATPQNSIMIGDSLEADVVGAREAGWAHIYFNPNQEPHQEDVMHEIQSLKELTNFFK